MESAERGKPSLIANRSCALIITPVLSDTVYLTPTVAQLSLGSFSTSFVTWTETEPGLNLWMV